MRKSPHNMSEDTLAEQNSAVEPAPGRQSATAFAQSETSTVPRNGQVSRSIEGRSSAGSKGTFTGYRDQDPNDDELDEKADYSSAGDENKDNDGEGEGEDGEQAAMEYNNRKTRKPLAPRCILNGYRCVGCGKCFDRKYQLRAHEAEPHSQANLKCRRCNRTYPPLDSLKEHLKTCQPGKLRVPCPDNECSQSFRTPEGFYVHAQTYHRHLVPDAPEPERHVCTICSSSYKFKGSLTRHLLTEHRIKTRGGKHYVCPKNCATRNGEHFVVKKHISKKHPGQNLEPLLRDPPAEQ